MQMFKIKVVKKYMSDNLFLKIYKLLYVFINLIFLYIFFNVFRQIKPDRNL